LDICSVDCLCAPEMVGKRFDGMWLRVVRDLRTSSSRAEHERSHKNYGMVYCHVIEHDAHYVGVNPFEEPAAMSENEDENVLAATHANNHHNHADIGADNKHDTSSEDEEED